MTQVVMRAEAVTRRLAGEVPVTLVENADIEVRRGEFVVVTGPSGSGKSSLLYLLGLLDVPTNGRIWLNGKETWSLDQDELAEVRLADLGFVFQSHFLLPEFSALENVMLPMQRLGHLTPSEIRARAKALLADFGLSEQVDKLPKQLSGGQSQRVAVARALANDPVLILADEPTGNLDTSSAANVQKIMRDLAHEHGRAVLIVTHDPRFAASADRVISMVDGSIIAT